MAIQVKNREAVVSGVREQARVEGAAGTTIAETVDRTASIGASVVLPKAVAVSVQQHEQAQAMRYAGAVLPAPIRASQIADAAEVGGNSGDYGATIAADKAESLARERGAGRGDISSERREAAEISRQYSAAIRAAAQNKKQS